MSKLEKILKVSFPNGTKIINATNSSKKIKENTLFFALQGQKMHGSVFIEDAINMGVSAVVHNNSKFRSDSPLVFFIQDLDSKIIDILTCLNKIDINNNNFFAFTGTNGKTSSAYFCHQILRFGGYDSLYIGTLGIQYNESKLEKKFSDKTTPDIFELFEIIKSFSFKNPVNICIEISSHALDQKRLQGIKFLNSAAVLNIKSDHIDYHKSIEKYRDAKFEIFRMNSALKLINENLKEFIDSYDHIVNNQYKLLCVSESNEFSDIFYKIENISIDETIFEIHINSSGHFYGFSNKKKYKFICKIFPSFNIDNLVFAICSIGFDLFKESELNDLSFIEMPKGRAEVIKNIPTNIIIDYAHNHEAIEIFLHSIKDYFKNLIVILGCGGDRDKSKRDKMLRSAIKNSSKVIFTSDNSRSENFNDIFSHASENNDVKNVHKIKDRKEAINYGVTILSKDDCLVILGKGHEETQEENGKFMFFSDHEVVNEIYK